LIEVIYFKISTAFPYNYAVKWILFIQLFGGGLVGLALAIIYCRLLDKKKSQVILKIVDK
ncbi:O10 family O-antigen flippase, partial [Escherichia marmotae]|nr:O10 family O-antigen flippase [Escherichia marmotae]